VCRNVFVAAVPLALDASRARSRTRREALHQVGQGRVGLLDRRARSSTKLADLLPLPLKRRALVVGKERPLPDRRRSARMTLVAGSGSRRAARSSRPRGRGGQLAVGHLRPSPGRDDVARAVRRRLVVAAVEQLVEESRGSGASPGAGSGRAGDRRLRRGAARRWTLAVGSRPPGEWVGPRRRRRAGRRPPTGYPRSGHHRTGSGLSALSTAALGSSTESAPGRRADELEVAGTAFACESGAESRASLACRSSQRCELRLGLGACLSVDWSSAVVLGGRTAPSGRSVRRRWATSATLTTAEHHQDFRRAISGPIPIRA
jgi:hypothetical protein